MHNVGGKLVNDIKTMHFNILSCVRVNMGERFSGLIVM